MAIWRHYSGQLMDGNVSKRQHKLFSFNFQAQNEVEALFENFILHTVGHVYCSTKTKYPCYRGVRKSG